MREQDRGGTKLLFFLNLTTIMKHIRDAFWLLLSSTNFFSEIFRQPSFQTYTAAQILIHSQFNDHILDKNSH